MLYGKFDGTAVTYMDEDHQFVRDDNILFVYSGDRMSPDTVKMIRDEILVKVYHRVMTLYCHVRSYSVLLYGQGQVRVLLNCLCSTLLILKNMLSVPLQFFRSGIQQSHYGEEPLLLRYCLPIIDCAAWLI